MQWNWGETRAKQLANQIRSFLCDKCILCFINIASHSCFCVVPCLIYVCVCVFFSFFQNNEKYISSIIIMHLNFLLHASVSVCHIFADLCSFPLWQCTLDLCSPFVRWTIPSVFADKKSYIPDHKIYSLRAYVLEKFLFI